MKIPKIIHQIWFQGEAAIPPHLLAYHNTWIELNPDYEILVWDQKKIENLVNQQESWIKDTYFFYQKMIQKIDFAKYVILYHYGGIYMDMDIKCLQSLNNTPTINESDIIVSYMHTVLIQKITLSFYVKKIITDDFINNGTIMCSPKSEFMWLTIKEAFNLKDFTKLILPFMHVLATTGPFCFTIAYMKYKTTDNFQKNKMHILDKSYFENCDIFMIKNKSCEIPDHAIGIHYYANSWTTPTEKKLVIFYGFLVKYWYIFFISILILLYCLFMPKKRSTRSAVYRNAVKARK
jgi:mannosyltransferase OCH1-like enzyme